MNVDIKFIAKKSGVSPATVSRVLNKTKPVSKELEEKVMAEVVKYNYRTNYLARGLLLNKSNLIGVIAPNVSNVFHAEIISNIEEYANKNGYNVIISNVYLSYEKMKNSFLIMHDRRVDGIIILHENEPDEINSLKKLINVPIVLASVNILDTELSTVGIDDEKAAFDAVSYLIRLGHKRIAGIFSNGYSLGTLRKNGYLKALNINGLDVINEQIINTELCNMEQGGLAIQRLLNYYSRPTAVFCVSDELAIGVSNYMLDHGYRLPMEMSIFGFDDINLASVIRPKLSTIRQPIAEIGRKATEMLIELMEGRSLLSNNVVFPHQVIVRGSCFPI